MSRHPCLRCPLGGLSLLAPYCLRARYDRMRLALWMLENA